MLTPDELMDSIVIEDLPQLRKMTDDEFNELQKEFEELAQAA